MYYPNFRLKSNKVPILSAEEIDIIAERFVSDFINESEETIIPFDIEKFLEFYLQVEMEYEDLSQDKSCLGMTVFNNSSRIIAYDSINNRAKYISAHEGTIIIDNSLLESGQEKRLRFTLGHEACILRRPAALDAFPGGSYAEHNGSQENAKYQLLWSGLWLDYHSVMFCRPLHDRIG